MQPIDKPGKQRSRMKAPRILHVDDEPGIRMSVVFAIGRALQLERDRVRSPGAST